MLDNNNPIYKNIQKERKGHLDKLSYISTVKIYNTLIS